jgi:hypothetical protein
MFAPQLMYPGITVPLFKMCGPAIMHPLFCHTTGIATASVIIAVAIATLPTGVFISSRSRG